jgi:hypothetical protein
MAQKHKLSLAKQIGIHSADLLKNSEPAEYLSTIRLTINHTHYSDIISDIERYPYSVTHLLSSRKIRKITDLDTPNLVYLNFDSEFAWAKNILIRNIDSINAFLKLSKEFSSELLKGNYLEASNILDKIESEFGQSLWLIKTKIAFLQLTEGLEAQKKYTQNIKEKLRNGGLVKFIAHWTSIRNEGQTTVSRFSSQVDTIINKLHPITQIGYKEYCQYHILSSDPKTPDEFIHVLRLEYSKSLIDYYEAFVTLLRVMLLDNSERLVAKINYLFESDKFDIHDERLNLLKALSNKDEDFVIPVTNKQVVEPYDLFLEGKYENAYDLALSALNGLSHDPSLISIAAYAKAMLSEESNKDRDSLLQDLNTSPLYLNIINGLAKIISNGSVAASKELNDLNKLSTNFSNFSWATAISILIAKENIILTPLNHDTSLLALKVPYFHPNLIECFSELSIGNKYADYCLLSCYNSISTRYSMQLKNKKIDTLDSLSSHSSDLLQGIVNYSNGYFKDAIKFGEKLSEATHGYYLRRGYSLISHSYLKLNNLLEACRTTAQFYLKERQFYPFLPILELYECIKPGTAEWGATSLAMDLSIVLDACVKYINKDAETNRRFAYEDFLLENGFNRPSELQMEYSKYDINKLIYYLRYICVEVNMDTSGAFEGGSQEVVAERLAVCRFLSEIDSDNIEVYRQEIKELVRKQVITNRRQEVDKSRIYVDVDSIKEWAGHELKENYSRYIEYLKYGISSPTKTTAQEKNQFGNGERTSVNSMNIPDDEVSALLRYMVEEIIDAYLGPDFGLDRFLSTRIRHGILEGHLRKPIQNHNLITKKEFKNGPYMANDFWLDKLKPAERSLSQELDKAFSKFSEQYDNLILKITNEWLQVKKSKKPYGLFDFILEERDIAKVSSFTNKETAFKNFVDKVIDMLENTLVLNLVKIREELNSKAKQEAKRLLNELQEKVSKNPSSINIELQSAINQARTDMQSQFEKVIEWFVPSTMGNTAPFTIEDAIMVADAIIKEGNNSFNLNSISEKDTDISIHGQLPIFVDIFVNIFENVVKRSGLADPVADVNVWVEELSPNLSIMWFKVQNKLGPGIDIQERDTELKRKKNLLQNGEYTQYLATERNSGLFKIYKSVKDFKAIGFDRDSTMDFGIEDDKFQITISVPFRIFTLKPDSE